MKNMRGYGHNSDIQQQTLNIRHIRKKLDTKPNCFGFQSRALYQMSALRKFRVQVIGIPSRLFKEIIPFYNARRGGISGAMGTAVTFDITMNRDPNPEILSFDLILTLSGPVGKDAFEILKRGVDVMKNYLDGFAAMHKKTISSTFVHVMDSDILNSKIKEANAREVRTSRTGEVGHTDTYIVTVRKC